MGIATPCWWTKHASWTHTSSASTSASHGAASACGSAPIWQCACNATQARRHFGLCLIVALPSSLASSASTGVLCTTSSGSCTVRQKPLSIAPRLQANGECLPGASELTSARERFMLTRTRPNTSNEASLQMHAAYSDTLSAGVECAVHPDRLSARCTGRSGSSLQLHANPRGYEDNGNPGSQLPVKKRQPCTAVAHRCMHETSGAVTMSPRQPGHGGRPCDAGFRWLW